MIIKRVTLTGADDNTDIDWMFETAKKFPFVEFGILFSPKHLHLLHGKPRYPSKAWVEKLVARHTGMENINLSAHLCGGYTTELLLGNNAMIIRDLKELIVVFSRIQLNYNEKKTPVDKSFFEALNRDLFVMRRPIIQHNFNNAVTAQMMIHRKMRVDFLYDGSGGNGRMAKKYFAPIEGHYTGYAGGFSPDNILGELEKINKVCQPEDEIWVDVESGIRSDAMFPNPEAMLGDAQPENIFDTQKAERFLKDCEDFNRDNEPFYFEHAYKHTFEFKSKSGKSMTIAADYKAEIDKVMTIALARKEPVYYVNVDGETVVEDQSA